MVTTIEDAIEQPRKKSRSVTKKRDPTKNGDSIAKVLPVIVRNGWLNATDVCSLELTCRSAKKYWCSDSDVWKPLALLEWPNLADNYQKVTAEAPILAEVLTNKSLFCDPRLWLAAEAQRVKCLPKWFKKVHLDVECGRCGCNCADGECGGIPIESEFRWELKSSLQKVKRFKPFLTIVSDLFLEIRRLSSYVRS